MRTPQRLQSATVRLVRSGERTISNDRLSVKRRFRGQASLRVHDRSLDFDLPLNGLEVRERVFARRGGQIGGGDGGS